MDGVLCDFRSASKKEIQENPKQPFPQSRWGFFLRIPEMDGAIESFNLLKDKYDIWILTRPSTKNINCYSEKAQWISDHLGVEMLSKLIISPDKSLVKGEYLIDDENNANQDKFEGVWIKFGSNKFPNWKIVTNWLISQLDTNKQNLCEYLMFKDKSILDGLEYQVRIFESDGVKTSDLDLKIDYNRLNIRLKKDTIDYAYFG